MKIIKDFEGEDLEVSDFGEWIGKDYIDYKSEYKSNQKLIKILLQENQELKKQLERKYEKVGTLTGELLYEENTKLINQQKEFINYLESESKELIRDAGYHQRICLEILEKYKGIIGGSNENNSI